MQMVYICFKNRKNSGTLIKNILNIFKKKAYAYHLQWGLRCAITVALHAKRKIAYDLECIKFGRL